MPRRCVVDAARSRSRPAVGQHGLGAASVRLAGASLHEPIEHEAIDQTRHAALRQDHVIGQMAHADPPVGRLRDGQERVVLGEGEVVVGAQLVVETARDPGMGHEELAPWSKARIACGERALDRLGGDGHGLMLHPDVVANRGSLTMQRYRDMVATSTTGTIPDLAPHLTQAKETHP